MRARIVEVIVTAESRGLGGTEDDPVRHVMQLWSKDGRLICEQDPMRFTTGAVDYEMLRELMETKDP